MGKTRFLTGKKNQFSKLVKNRKESIFPNRQYLGVGFKGFHWGFFLEGKGDGREGRGRW